MAFQEEVFPALLLVGSSGGPTWDKEVIRYGQGSRFVNENINYSVYRFTLKHIEQTNDLWSDIIEFFEGLGGPTNGFLLLNPFDQTSLGPLDTPTISDQSLGLLSGGNTIQLVKNYITGSNSETKPIYKPIAGTVRVSWASGSPLTLAERTESVDWTIDATTGLITILTSPLPDQPIFAGYKFYTPVALEDSDQLSNINFFSSVAASLSSLNLVELPKGQ